MRLFSRIIFVLTAFLGLAVVMFTMVSESGSFPSFTNTKSTGLAAFGELLTKRGYRVRVDRRIGPIVKPGEILLVPVENQSQDQLEMSEGPTREFHRRVDRILEAGTTGLFLRFGRYRANLPQPQGVSNVGLVGATRTYSLAVDATWPELQSSDLAVPLAEIQPKVVSGLPVLTVAGMRKGAKVTLRDASILANRSITYHDHASFGLDLIQRLAKPGSTIVVAEFGIGNQTGESALDHLGSWAHSVAWQALIVLVAIVYSAGRRFGSIESAPPPSRTARDLIEAMAATLQRAKHRNQALQILLNDAHDRVRMALQAPVGTSPDQLMRLVPPELGAALGAVRTSFDRILTSREALQIASQLELALASFESEMKATRASRSK